MRGQREGETDVLRVVVPEAVFQVVNLHPAVSGGFFLNFGHAELGGSANHLQVPVFQWKLFTLHVGVACYRQCLPQYVETFAVGGESPFLCTLTLLRGGTGARSCLSGGLDCGLL
jgi:hypothetical protein